MKRGNYWVFSCSIIIAREIAVSHKNNILTDRIFLQISGRKQISAQPVINGTTVLWRGSVDGSDKAQAPTLSCHQCCHPWGMKMQTRTHKWMITTKRRKIKQTPHQSLKISRKRSLQKYSMIEAQWRLRKGAKDESRSRDRMVILRTDWGRAPQKSSGVHGCKDENREIIGNTWKNNWDS